MIPKIIFFLLVMTGLASAQPMSVIEKQTGIIFSQFAGHPEGSVRYRYSLIRNMVTTWYWLNHYQRPVGTNRYLLANAWIDSAGFSRVKSEVKPAIVDTTYRSDALRVRFYESVADSQPVAFQTIRQFTDSLSITDSSAFSGKKVSVCFLRDGCRVQEWDGELLTSELTWFPDRTVVFKKRKRNGVWEEEYFSW